MAEQSDEHCGGVSNVNPKSPTVVPLVDFILTKPFSDLLFHMNGGSVILKETSPIHIEYSLQDEGDHSEKLCIDSQFNRTTRYPQCRG